MGLGAVFISLESSETRRFVFKTRLLLEILRYTKQEQTEQMENVEQIQIRKRIRNVRCEKSRQFVVEFAGVLRVGEILQSLPQVAHVVKATSVR